VRPDAYGDANAVAMEIGEFEVLPIVEEIPVICGVHATDPRRRMWHWLLQVKDMGFSALIIPHALHRDGLFRQILEETGMSVKKEFEMVALAARWICSPSSMSPRPRKPKRWPQPAPTRLSRTSHDGRRSIGVKGAVSPWTKR